MNLHNITFYICLVVFLFTNKTIWGQESFEWYKSIVEPGEIDIVDNQLSVIPNHGIYLLLGNKMMSLEGNEEIPQVLIPKQLHPESILFTQNDVLACDDTTIVSCKSTPVTLFAFDTNQFKIMPATDDGVFVTTNIESDYAIYYCNLENKTMEPFMKLNEEVELIAGDTTLCVIVTKYNIYSYRERKAMPMLNYFEPIKTATITSHGIVFSTEKSILLLEGANRVSLIGDKGCKRLLSDNDTLYIFYDSGALVAYNMNQVE